MLKPIARKRGFTLIELLIVLSILAVLAGIVLLVVTTFVGRGQTEACETDLRSLQTAVTAYYHGNDGHWPTADDEVPGDLFDGDPVTGPLVGGYILEVPESDADCDWQIDDHGTVFPNTADDCPCD